MVKHIQTKLKGTIFLVSLLCNSSKQIITDFSYTPKNVRKPRYQGVQKEAFITFFEALKSSMKNVLGSAFNLTELLYRSLEPNGLILTKQQGYSLDNACSLQLIPYKYVQLQS